jgi:hypothetical protein
VPTPTGPAVIDFPGGGVSAVHVYDRGYCSKDITIDSIASQVQDGVWNNVWQQATPHGCAIARQYWSHYASYVSEVRSLSPDPAPSGGFVFNASYQIDPTVPGIPSFNVNFMYSYDFALAGGILSVTPAVVSFNPSGYKASQTGGKLADALETTVPSTLYAQSLTGQMVDIDQASTGNNCTPRAAGDTSISTDPTQPGYGSCSQLQLELSLALQQAAGNGTLTNIGSTDPYSDATRLTDIVNAINGSTNTYQNWSCVDSGRTGADGNEINRCMYTLRAKRVNVYPDLLELVWFDTINDNTSALPIYAVLKTTANSTQLAQLCTQEETSNEFYLRSFTFRNEGYIEVDPSQGVLDCIGHSL